LCQHRFSLILGNKYTGLGLLGPMPGLFSVIRSSLACHLSEDLVGTHSLPALWRHKIKQVQSCKEVGVWSRAESWPRSLRSLALWSSALCHLFCTLILTGALLRHIEQLLLSSCICWWGMWPKGWIHLLETKWIHLQVLG
jgi:hypothetical protein